MTKSSDSIYNEVFVSYSRKNGVFAQKIVQAIYDSGRENVWIDWEDIEYAEDWWQKIQAGIDSADNFIFILTPESAQSKVCYDEVDYAVKSGKRIIPVEHIAVTEQSDFEQMHPNVSSHNWLPFKEDDNFDEGMKQLVKTLETDLKHVKLHTRFLVRARDWEIGDRDPSFLLTGAEIDSAETWLVEADKQKKSPEPTPLHREYIASAREKDLAEKKRLRLLTLSLVSLIIATLLGIGIVLFNSNQELLSEQATLQFQLAHNEAQVDWVATRSRGIGIGGFPPVDLTQTPVLDFLATSTTQAELANFWEPIKRQTNCVDDYCVEMVLVPSGCFWMGSLLSVAEMPHEVCIEQDFWIDQYEVTNHQFEVFGGEATLRPDWSEPTQPRTSVSWFEAQTFCELRGGSLPTEVQWEYAARGNNSLVYPWGNDFIAQNVPSDVASSVGHYEGNISWVGAYDMSGNVWEWLSSAYQQYPYDATDGREDLDDENVSRVLRGGSFFDNANSMRSANRSFDDPAYGSGFFGFRCVLFATAQEAQ